MATPTTALLVQSEATVRGETVACLRALGFSVIDCDDECQFYAQAIRLMGTPGRDRGSFVILAEPTANVIRDLKTLRRCLPRNGIVLMGGGEDPEVERELGATRLSCARPSSEELWRAIDAAFAASGAT